MAELVMLTAEPDGAARVLPALTLLAHHVHVAPMSPSALVEHEGVAAVLLDARTDLVAARALCRTLSGPMAAPPVLLVLAEGGFTAVSRTWGAADVVLADAGPAEVEARLRMIAEAENPAPQVQGSAERVEVGDLVIDASAYTARVRGRALDLTYKEFELLRHLAQNPGRVLSRAQLLQEVWGYDYFGGTRTVDVHVRRLRAKLGSEHDQLIGTVRNVGYRFDPRGRDTVVSEIDLGDRPAVPRAASSSRAASTGSTAASGRTTNSGSTAASGRTTNSGSAANSGSTATPGRPEMPGRTAAPGRSTTYRPPGR